jgi:hypothetical protein
MKKTTENFARNTAFDVSIKGYGSPEKIAEDLRRIADELMIAVMPRTPNATIEEDDVAGEYERGTVVATLKLKTVDNQDGETAYTILDEHPAKDTENNLFYDIVSDCVFTPSDEELAEIEAQDAWDGYLLAVEY